MDGLELSLPADVMVSNLLAAEARVSTALEANVSVLRTLSATVCNSSSMGDMMNPVTISDQSSISTNKDAVLELHMHEKLPPSCDCDDGSKSLGRNDANNPFLLLPKCASSHCRAGKMPRISSPCSKRPRTYRGENSMGIARANVDNAVCRKTRCNLTKCTPAEKSRVIRQRNDQGGKRGDKRSFKTLTKTKLDNFMSKAGLVSSNSTYGGSNILGVYGLKSDIHDVTKHVDEISLSELIDGSYKCPSLCRDKGKKVADTNESVVCSVKKACSILLRHSAVESRNTGELGSVCGRRTHPGRLSSSSCVTSGTNLDNRDNCKSDLASSNKDYSIPGALASLCDSPLYQPKDILERLALPPTNDLDTLLRDAPVPAVSLQNNDMHSGTQTSHKSSLPPFAWSLSLGGSSKVNIDSGKLFTNRNTCNTRWVRLGSLCTLLGNATSYFSDDHHTGVPPQELHIDMQVDTQRTVTCTSHASDKNILEKGSNVMSSYNSLESEGCLNSTYSHQDFAYKERIFVRTREAEGSSKHNGNEAISVDQGKNANTFTERERTKRIMHSGTDGISCNSPLTCTVSGYNQCSWHLPPPGSSKQVVMSPRLLAAAQILCELASHSSLTGKQEEKFKWLKKPSQKTIKNKMRSSTGKAEGLSVTLEPLPKPGHAGKSTGLMPPLRPKLSIDKKKNHTDMKGIHEGSIKWSVPSVSRFPDSSERDIIASTKQWNVDPSKLVGLMASPSPAEKACGSQQKLRKTVLKGPVVNHRKDWGQGGSKRE